MDIIKRWGLYFLVMGLGWGVYYFRRYIYTWIKSPLLPYILIGVVVLILIIIIFLVFFFRGAKKKPPAEEAEEEPSVEVEEKAVADKALAKKYKFSSIKLRKIFNRAMKLMKNNVSGRNYRYQIPWLLMLGEASSGKTSTLGKSGLRLPLDRPGKVAGRAGEKDSCKWWFFEKGIVLDISGDLVLREDGETSDKKIWKLLLRLLQKHRPERPIDGIILTIPCSDLIGETSIDRSHLDRAAKKADQLNKKLWDAQRVLGIRFPIYILVTKCDQVEGFKTFCQELPDSLGDNIYGWSNPYAIDTGYSEDWVKQAFQHVNKDLFQAQFEMFTEGVRPEKSESFFSFPARFKELSGPLQIYMDRIFRQSVYHESFFFRGLYFCGDSGIEEVKNTSKKIFFVKELFEKKIFSEFRLAAPLKKTLLSKNRSVLATQIAAVLLTIIGAVGLWSAYDQLLDDKRAMLPVLEQVHDDLDRIHRQERISTEGLMLYDILSRPSGEVIPFEKSAMNLFEGMTNFQSLTYFFIPASWISDIHEELRKSMILAYDEIILKAMYIQLLQKAKTIFEASKADVNAAIADEENVAVDKLPEFIAMKTFVADLTELEKYADLYNGLRASKNLTDLGRVVKYLFDMDLPSGFYKNVRYYHDALGKTKYRTFDPSIFRIKAKYFTLKKMSGNMYSRLFDSNIVDVNLEDLSRKLEKFKRDRRRNSIRKVKLIKQLLEAISKTETLLAKAELFWIYNKTFNLGEPFENMLAAVEKSNFLGADMRAEIEEAGGKAFIKLKGNLKQKKSTLTGPLLERVNPGEQGAGMIATLAQKAGELLDSDSDSGDSDSGEDDRFAMIKDDKELSDENFFDEEDNIVEDPEDAVIDKESSDEDGDVDEDEEDEEEAEDGSENQEKIVANRLSPGVLALKTELEKLLSQEFMDIDFAESEEIEIPSKTRLRWDKNLLSQAVKIFEPYEAYLNNGLQSFPVNLQHAISSMAKESLEKKVQDLVAQAQSFEPLREELDGTLPETDVLLEIRNFNKSSMLLIRLLTYCDKLDLVKSYQILSDILYWQTATLLEAFNGYLEDENLYGVKDGSLSWWQGDDKVSFASFEVMDQKELKNYLKLQRNRIKYLAREYAQPLVSFFMSSNVLRNRNEEQVLFKWDRVLTELEKYINKKPKNSVGILETYILFELDKINENNFFKVISQEDLKETSGDIFLQKRNELRRMMYRQCQILASKNILKQYNAIKDYFEQRLSGRFPFAKTTSHKIYSEAEPEDIRDFYLVFDKISPTIKSVLQGGDQFGISKDHALEFIGQMEDVRGFFASYLNEKEKQEEPEFDLNVEFRVNQGHESAANRIIEWKFAVGEQVFDENSPENLGRWRIGVPLKLSLRWAKNAIEHPVFLENVEGVTINDKTVEFEFKNKWSLIRLLGLHAGSPEDFDRLKDQKPHTLKFEVTTKRAGFEKHQQGESKAKAFIRVNVLTTGKKKIIVVMPQFPDTAPELKIGKN